MEITKKNRRNLKFQNITFIILFITALILLAWLTQKYKFESDWTATQRNTLSNASIELLKKINDDISITAFAREADVSQQRPLIKALISKYQKHTDKIELAFINPEIDPTTTRKLGIRAEGEMIISIGGRTEHLISVKEEDLTNALQRLIRSGGHKIRFITGHGERVPTGKANHDYQLFTTNLQNKGILISSLNLAETHAIPTQTNTLVIASPRVNYLQGEVKLIQTFINNGGNLLWLQEPGNLFNLEPLAQQLNIKFIKGVIVDPTTQMLGIPATSALAESYAPHAITQDFKLGTVFPHSGGLKLIDDKNTSWQTRPLIKTTENSWLEAGKLQGEVEYNPKTDTLGPITISMVLERVVENSLNKKPDTSIKQRIIVIADSDFLSNQYLGNLGNKDMGLRIFNWLNNDDKLISIPATTAPDIKLKLDGTVWAVIGLFFLIGMPLIFIASGVIIWRKRKNK